MTTTSKLSETQIEVLTQATYRPSGSIEPMPARLNRLLRSLFESVELDASMAPLAVTWTVPEWRA